MYSVGTGRGGIMRHANHKDTTSFGQALGCMVTGVVGYRANRITRATEFFFDGRLRESQHLQQIIRAGYVDAESDPTFTGPWHKLQVEINRER